MQGKKRKKDRLCCTEQYFRLERKNPKQTKTVKERERGENTESKKSLRRREKKKEKEREQEEVEKITKLSDGRERIRLKIPPKKTVQEDPHPNKFYTVESYREAMLSPPKPKMSAKSKLIEKRLQARTRPSASGAANCDGADEGDSASSPSSPSACAPCG